MRDDNRLISRPLTEKYLALQNQATGIDTVEQPFPKLTASILLAPEQGSIRPRLATDLDQHIVPFPGDLV
jgi:hypothetical protein